MIASISPVHGRRWAAVTSCCMLLLLAACGGGMGYGGSSSTMTSTPPPAATASSAGADGSCSSVSCGSAMVTVTDAKGDFLSYIVSVTSLQLQTANGTSVETIPAATKVDFAQLVDLSEVLSARQIPPGEYVSARLTLDYTNAQITADDGTGNPVALSPVDASGVPIAAPVTVTVELDNAHHLHITAAQIARLALDFNLAVSNVVDLTADTVTVAPTLVASVAPADVKPVRVRGSLGTVTSGDNDFVVEVMPFHDEDETTGQVTVHVGASTTYQINGTAYSGDAGIAALAAVASGTKVAAFGTVQNGDQSTFAATTVLAGTSLESPGQDRIAGTVIARNQNTLTIRNATWSESDGDFDFERKDATVMVGPATVVTEVGHAGSFTVSDISVGQRIDASGAASKGDDGSITLDASGGQVNLDVTSASGTVTRLADGSLTFSLQSLGGLPATAFDFSGTGPTAAKDATAAAYVVDTGTLTQSNLSLNSPAQALGFVTGFGAAPPDFTADTLITAPSVQAQLQLRFGRHGSPDAFIGLSPSSTALLIDLSSLSTSGGGSNDGGNNGGSNGGGHDGGDGNAAPGTTVHDQGPGGGGDDGNGDHGGSGGSDGDGDHGGSDGNGNSGPGGGDDGNGPFIEMGPQRLDVRQLVSLSIVADTSPGGDAFTIGHATGMRNDNFSTFSDFVAQLSSDLLGGGTAVIAVTASGRFDVSSGTFTATNIAVLLTN
ncbi:MAG TPA: DUF4382 domain-containing protein [Steroidobacteraceae bacterium]|nr:DUF4382 domain-containing protein [Steroidobacteraceae bacterium]